ncbi:MAG: hypothetical protein JW779_03375 [Candidatus Thorarchaeota archaeon]|nr:hypothetical protein [Candidatus Thorarchaeota archaeon]
MEEFAERLKDYFAQDDIPSIKSLIEKTINEYEWKNLVNVLRNVTKSLYGQHLLKTNYMILSIFGFRELIGVDCDIFSELASIQHPISLDYVSDVFFDNLIQVIRTQFKSGGSTLFFDIDKISKTKSAIIANDLLEARYRETIFILAEFDEKLPSLTNEWVNVARLWRIGYGLRILKARNHGMMIHVNEYKEIRNRIMNELGINPERLIEERDRLKMEDNLQYLQLSDTLDNFVLSYIMSLGVRGRFEPHYKSLINHEGLDEF